MHRLPSLALVLGLILAAWAGAAGAAGARLGDPAKPLAIKDWIQGKPVDVLDGKNLYVVEFWATWCGPCKVTVPRLTEMQAKFKDRGVVFVGVSDEPAETVKPFVASMGDKMGYIVACDDERKTAMGYMEAYGQAGIPMAFVVGRDKRVLWYGHPMGDLEMVLGKILEGTYDLKAVAAKLDAESLMNEYTQLAMQGDPRMDEVGERILEGFQGEYNGLVNFAFNVLVNPRIKQRNIPQAMKAVDRAEKLSAPGDFRIVGIRGVGRFLSGRKEEGLELAREAVKLCKEPQFLPMFQQFVRVMEKDLGVTGSAPAPAPAPAPGAGSPAASAMPLNPPSGGAVGASSPKPMVPPGTVPARTNAVK